MTDFASDFTVYKYRVLVESEKGDKFYVTVYAGDQWEALKKAAEKWPMLEPLNAAESWDSLKAEGLDETELRMLAGDR